MDPVTIAFAGLTSTATVLAITLILRSLRGERDPWGDNPWGTGVVVDDAMTHSPIVRAVPPKRRASVPMLRPRRKQRVRRIVTEALPKERLGPAQRLFDTPPELR